MAAFVDSFLSPFLVKWNPFLATWLMKEKEMMCHLKGSQIFSFFLASKRACGMIHTFIMSLLSIKDEYVTCLSRKWLLRNLNKRNFDVLKLLFKHPKCKLMEKSLLMKITFRRISFNFKEAQKLIDLVGFCTYGLCYNIQIFLWSIEFFLSVSLIYYVVQHFFFSYPSQSRLVFL